MKVAILGSGAFGIALSKVFIENTSDITMWTVASEYEELTKYRTNNKVLKNIKIDKRIKISTDLKETITNADIIVIAIPVKYVSSTTQKIAGYITNKQHICIASKGIEQGSCLFVHNIIKKYIHTNKINVISGGTFAIDMANKYPMGLTIASKNKKSALVIKKALTNSFITCEIVNDIFGVEMYGAIKNVFAIATGILEGLNLPESTKCTFITKCLNETKELIHSLGGNKKTIFTYAGFGDILLTCTSPKSRNFTLGKMIGEKRNKEEINNYINTTTIEGLYTLKSIKDLLHKNNKQIPLINYLYAIIYDNKEPESLIDLITK